VVGQVEETYRRFAVEEAHDSSPTYERLPTARPVPLAEAPTATKGGAPPPASADRKGIVLRYVVARAAGWSL